MPEPAARTILLVEDDPGLCRALAAGLEEAGYETRVVHTAVAGLAQARDWRPDLVLLDLRLPDLDGPALLGRLAADPRTAGIPLVAMCREADPDSAGAARAAGAQAVLTAPFEVEEVRRTVAAQVARTGRPGRGSGWEGTIGQGISRLVHADLDAERVCRAVVDGALELLDLAAATLWLADGDELELRVETALFERLPRAHRRLRVGEGLVGAVALERRPITVDDAGQDPRVRNRALFEALGLRGFVAVPLLHEGRLLGVLSGARSAPGPFRPEDVPVLAALADHAAAVLAQARQLHESERRRRTAEALAALAAEVSAAEEPEAVLDRVLEQVRLLVRADVPYLHVVAPAEGHLPLVRLPGGQGPRRARLDPTGGTGVGDWVLANDRPFRTADYLADPRISHDRDDVVREEGIVSALAVPVRLRGRLVGVLGAMRRGPRAFTEEDERVLEQLAAQAAVALGNVWLYREVARAKQQWELTVDNLHEGLALVDLDLRILRANRAFAAWTGCRPDALVGRLLEEALPLYATPEGRERLAQARGAAGPRTTTVEDPARGRTLEETLAPVAAAEGIRAGLVVTLRDITEARRLSAQLSQTEKLASLGEMLAGVAHELNNPLTGVLGFAQLLEAQVTDPAQKDDLRKLANEALRAARLVQHLLRFSRQHPPERRATDLNALARAAVELLDGACRSDGIALEADLDPRLPVSWVDPHQLQQVIVNLLTNARQAMSTGRRQGRILVRTRRAGATIELDVLDAGPGIPPDVLPRIFDPFFTTKAPGEGTGLGLSLCYSVVSAHQGEIWAAGAPGGGTALHVRLPVVLPPGEAPHAAPVAQGARHPAAAHARRILVAEDEPTLRDLVLEALAPRGHVVEAVSDGAAALQRLAEASFDVLLLDLRMPGMDGKETFERLAAGQPGAPRVVVMTGDAVRAETEAWLARVGMPILHKPFTLQALFDAVEK